MADRGTDIYIRSASGTDLDVVQSVTSDDTTQDTPSVQVVKETQSCVMEQREAAQTMSDVLKSRLTGTGSSVTMGSTNTDDVSGASLAVRPDNAEYQQEVLDDVMPADDDDDDVDIGDVSDAEESGSSRCAASVLEIALPQSSTPLPDVSGESPLPVDASGPSDITSPPEVAEESDIAVTSPVMAAELLDATEADVTQSEDDVTNATQVDDENKEEERAEVKEDQTECIDDVTQPSNETDDVKLSVDTTDDVMQPDEALQPDQGPSTR